MTHTCLRCGHVWDTKLEHPVACKHCNSVLWNTARRRKSGAGRKTRTLAEVTETIGQDEAGRPLDEIISKPSVEHFEHAVVDTTRGSRAFDNPDLYPGPGPGEGDDLAKPEDR